MANAKRIEETAINVLKAELLKCPYIEAYIDSNDKTPSWDGNIIVYKKVGGKKENILGKIPIQVKGTEKTPVAQNGTVSYSVAVSDLMNYYHDGGIIFFVVYVNVLMVTGKIYYADLLPFDLNHISADVAQKKKYTIHLKEFPVNNADEIANIFMAFASNRPKQMGIIGKQLPSIKGLEKQGAKIERFTFGATGIGLNQNNIGAFMASHSFYLYVKLKGSDIDIPVDKVEDAIVEKKIQAPIFVHNKKFYDEYSVVYRGSRSYIKIGNSLTFDQNDKSGQFEIKVKGKLEERINDIDFLLSFTKAEAILINGVELRIAPVEKEQIQRLVDLKQYWHDVKKMLQILGVNEELDCNQLTDRDYTNLRNFVNAVLYKKPIGFPHVEGALTYGLFCIANLQILLWYEKVDDRFYAIQSFFNIREIVSYESEQDKHSFKASQFLLLKKMDFSHVSNLNADIMIEDLNRAEIPGFIAEEMNFLLLNVLSSYDRQEHPNTKLLDLSARISQLLEQESVPLDKAIVQLNKLQIVKRQRNLSVDEIVQLSTLRNDSNPLMIRCGAFILLDDLDSAKECLEQMDIKEKEAFIKYPIYHFMNAS